jgi:hypothetical protein
MDSGRPFTLQISESVVVPPISGIADVRTVARFQDVLDWLPPGEYMVSIYVTSMGGEGAAYESAWPSEASD